MKPYCSDKFDSSSLLALAVLNAFIFVFKLAIVSKCKIFQVSHVMYSKVTYLDFSRTSLEIAKRRARMRNLTNIKWVQDGIENIPNISLGNMQMINTINLSLEA